jgi:hypothetical protein
MTLPDFHSKVKNSTDLPEWVLKDLESAMRSEISTLDLNIASLEALILLDSENEPDWN